MTADYIKNSGYKNKTKNKQTKQKTKTKKTTNFCAKNVI